MIFSNYKVYFFFIKKGSTGAESKCNILKEREGKVFMCTVSVQERNNYKNNTTDKKEKGMTSCH